MNVELWADADNDGGTAIDRLVLEDAVNDNTEADPFARFLATVVVEQAMYRVFGVT